MSGARDGFLLDPTWTFLNHGSFGACPRDVLAAQDRARAEMEAQPVRFMVRVLPERLAAVKARLADFVGAEAEDLALVPNATTAVNIVARSLHLAAGDEVVVSSQEYGACRKTIEFLCGRAGARLITAELALPLDEDQVVRAYAERLGPRTRLVLVSHIASPTGLILPVARVVAAAHGAGVPVLVDGAHGPGQLPLKLAGLGADWYTGNAHKWLFAPKVSAFLHVRRERREAIEPLIVSWGWPPPADALGGPLAALFDWPGTFDPTPHLALEAAVAFHRSVGWERLNAHNHGLARLARERLGQLTGYPPLCERDDGYAFLAAGELPPGEAKALQDRLHHEHRIEVPVNELGGRRFLRVSAQLYNSEEDIDRLVAALGTLL